MSIPPTRAAIGKPITLHLKNGMVWHGVLHPATDAVQYAIQRAGHVQAVRRSDVDTLIVRERQS